MGTEFSIGELSRRTGCNIQTIRYYEQIGLLAPPPRTEGGQRRYGPRWAERLSFIRHARDLGFDIAAIRQLIALGSEPDRSCTDVDHIVLEQIAAIESRIARLTTLKSELERMTERCGHGTVADCRVIESLADHGRCASAH